MKRNLLTASEVSARLGVRLETVYAYVSRGALSRTLGPDGHTSRFDPAEVDELARRGRPRSGKRVGSVDVTLATSITRVEPDATQDRLSYRGHPATELAAHASFERVAELLWTGALPDAASWPVDRTPRKLARALATCSRRRAPRSIASPRSPPPSGRSFPCVSTCARRRSCCTRAFS